jgi:hypothetical protein
VLTAGGQKKLRMGYYKSQAAKNQNDKIASKKCKLLFKMYEYQSSRGLLYVLLLVCVPFDFCLASLISLLFRVLQDIAGRSRVIAKFLDEETAKVVCRICWAAI